MTSATAPDDPQRLARRLGAAANIVHGFVYFSTEAADEFGRLGLEGRQQYFAARAAPMGPVTAPVVTAVFYNFAPSAVAAAIPSAWAVASPGDIQQARFAAVARVLDRTGTGLDEAELDEATRLADQLCRSLSYEAKPLAGANHAVERPDHPAVALWQLATVLREWRGDAHVAVLCATPVGAVEALILHAATGKVPAEVLLTTRRWTEAEWDAGISGLVERGLVKPDGSFSDQGRSFRRAIETRTDEACLALVECLGPTDTDRLCALLSQMGETLAGAGLYAQLAR